MLSKVHLTHLLTSPIKIGRNHSQSFGIQLYSSLWYLSTFVPALFDSVDAAFRQWTPNTDAPLSGSILLLLGPLCFILLIVAFYHREHPLMIHTRFQTQRWCPRRKHAGHTKCTEQHLLCGFGLPFKQCDCGKTSFEFNFLV